jgi:hypothetical protein
LYQKTGNAPDWLLPLGPVPLGGALVSGSLATPVNWLRQLVGLPVGCFLLGVASEIGVGACAPKTQPGAPWESPFRALGFKIEFWAPGFLHLVPVMSLLIDLEKTLTCVQIRSVDPLIDLELNAAPRQI